MRFFIKSIKKYIWYGLILLQSGLLIDLDPAAAQGDAVIIYDVVVYGGTSSGIIAAVQTARMRKSVVLIEAGRHLGGLTSGGLGQTDIGNKKAIGGMAREFYNRVHKHYNIENAWIYEKREDFRDGARDWDEEKAWWQFEPSVAENVFKEMIAEASIPVFLNERLDLKDGVTKESNRLTSIRMESGKVFYGKVFIDASYEGDLMAIAGVSYTVGRESNSEYGEKLNGVQTKNAIYHQLMDFVSPYIEPGNPTAGLLPGIDPAGPGEEGSGDMRVQAYCFRMCLTDIPENKISFEKPDGYDPLQYELLLRNFEAGENRVPWHSSRMPNRKTDTNNNMGVSTDYIGQNYHWPGVDYATREKIYKLHLIYQQGLVWTLANHPRVPEKIREEVQRWGLAKDEFLDNGHWSHQLYIREARRMVSDYIMTEHNCRGTRTAPRAIGLAAYTMDSHNVQRYIDASGYVKNEGDVQIGGFVPYPIDYFSIVPKTEECSNLIVPVCLSASHIAFGSIRMEPVFMVLGQSAAIAAALAIDDDITVQDVPYQKLMNHLVIAEQILELKDDR